MLRHFQKERDIIVDWRYSWLVILCLPFYHLRQVCDRNSPTIHTLTEPSHGNTVCNFQSTNE